MQDYLMWTELMCFTKSECHFLNLKQLTILLLFSVLQVSLALYASNRNSS
jgi:hypothetical protein